ncbi:MULTISPECIES: hypothetical protein [Glycomyces]|uniref:Uncharacterized protein n=1 Tax=Glycomyces lechevalierae TaxID=256034 RepID=A0A9X3PIF9_9ACTN|nr:hypothetical protein [Glycomyces lechevalierae]MDA1384665.1 hypothetical protein [Glycomyces lechevalierae]MDR7337882.1 hypothetical protein [Glycomyces lechevalierae]
MAHIEKRRGLLREGKPRQHMQCKTRIVVLAPLVNVIDTGGTNRVERALHEIMNARRRFRLPRFIMVGDWASPGFGH